MIFHILKRDLKRKRTMNVILFLFIVLASTFVASGLNNVITVMNGTDYFLDQAGVGDFVVITMGDGAVGCLDEMLETEEAVKAYRMETVVYGSQNNVKMEDGSKLECKNATVFQSIEDSAIHFFDQKNEEITAVEKGHIYIAGKFIEDNDLQEGDVVRLEHSGTKLTFVVDGMVKDALLGSEFMGNTRFLLNDEDMKTLLDNEEIYAHYRGEICYIDTDDAGAISSALSEVSNVSFDGQRSMLKTCYAVEMIIAFITLILSVCLMIVAFVVLKFSITFTITEEFREIGVMKAIGMSGGKIRRLYIVKYLFMASVGALFGFFVSIPFGKMLLDVASKKMVLGNDNGIFINVLGALLVVLVIVLFAYFCTGKVRKASPVDAIRSGQTGERYKNRSVLRIHKCPAGNAFFMAVNDILSSPKRFITIMVSFGICTLFVLMLVNTTSTMKSSNLIDTFGVTRTDLYMTDIADALEYMNTGSKDSMSEHLKEMEQELADEGMAAELCIELQYKYPITFEGKDYMLMCQQGLNTEISDYVFTEGVTPQNQNEIAITPQITEITGARIGDTLTIHYGKEDIDCIVTAYFQTMNSMGEMIRLHEAAPTDFDYISSALFYQIDFSDEPSGEEIERRKEKLKDYYHNDKVMNATEFCMDCIGVSDTMESVQFLSLGITLIVVILVIVFMERSFLADEKSQIAILKAIGFKNRAVMKWQVIRFGLVALMSVVLAAAVSIPMTELCITPVFGMMGAAEIDYNIEPLQIFVLYPGIVFMMTVVAAWITALYTRTIKSSDTANIE